MASDTNDLKADCITTGLGILYKSYNSYIGRTFLIDPTETQKTMYKKAENLSKVIIHNLKPKAKLSEVYGKAREFMKDNLSMVDVPKTFGFGTGLFLL